MIDETDLGDGRVRLSLRTSKNAEFGVIEGERRAAYRIAQIAVAHELVRRDDVRKTGAHAPCETCAFLSSLERNE